MPGPGGVCSRGVPGPGGGGGVWSGGWCLLRGGVCSQRGVGSAPRGGAWSRGVPGPGGMVVSGPGGGVCSGGVCSQGGIPVCTEADTPPPPWTDRRL